MQEMIRIQELEGKECLRLRPLWEDVFREDSREFTDYYFEEKAEGNHGFVLKIGEEDASMLYLSPYTMMLREGDVFVGREINYIVGVATKERYRHRGYMDRILRESLMFLRGKGQPFTFLMPASAEIYRPYQFAYIYDKEIFSTKKAIKVRPLEEDEFARLAEFASSLLEKEYRVFIKRDTAYYRKMEKELQAQNGGFYLFYGKNAEIKGYLAYTEENGIGDIQEAVIENGVDCPVYATGKKQPAIMARIVDVKAMLSMLRSSFGDVCCAIKVEDPVLAENGGIWECRITPRTAVVCKKESGPFECEIQIGQLASWIFGYKMAKDCFRFPDREKETDVLCKLKEIKKHYPVFINEIV